MCSGPYLTAASLTRLLRSKHAATRSLACPPPAKLQPTNLQALTVLTNLRKICNHPTLYTPEGGPGGDSSGEQGDEAQGFDATESGGNSGRGFCGNQKVGRVACCHEAAFAPAGKMAALGVLLHESLVTAGERVVVVSQSTAALDLVQVGGWMRGRPSGCWPCVSSLGQLSG